jgi:mycothiol synthase
MAGTPKRIRRPLTSAGAQEKSREDPSRGYIALLGVRPSYRRRGLGEALVLNAFEALSARGRRGVDLHVDADSLTGATRLYARVGMSAHPRFATWEKELRPARA